MTIQEIKKMVAGPEYNFLRTNPHVKDRLMFMTLGGSYAYGTNVETSDVDVRGCALNSPTDILGMTNFEQMIDNATDTTIYGFNKLVNLLFNCNPNTIEMLGCKPDHYFFVSPLGQEMIDNAHLFLSQRAFKSFGGYATQQLRRLENYLARAVLTQERKEEHLLHAITRTQED
ncbi:MAG: nucleotidyltransferase domain-containing protein, partial [Ruminococcus flavefaciens]|nr:nucleotidyltransferase domain-containing protein [Ruminococcus flavefaciens]